MAAYNKTLGKFQLVGIPPAPRGMPQVEVTFDIDANGILSVSAKDRGTGNEQQIRIEGGSGISDEEIQRMVRDAEQHADEDRAAHDLVDAKNQAEHLLYSTEKSLTEHGDKVDEETRTSIRTAIDDVRGTLETGDAATIRMKSEALQQASYKLAEAMYQHAQTPPSGEAAADAPGAADDEEVIEDAEIVDPDPASKT
jgi:molecular chaperone DnaK